MRAMRQVLVGSNERVRYTSR